MDKVKNILVTLLIAAVISLGLAGCKDSNKSEKPTKETVKKEAESKKAEAEKALKNEHPASEHPASEHPK